MQLPDLSLLVVVLVFWATYFVLRATVFKPLGAILEEREKTTADADEALRAALARQAETVAEIDRRLTGARREALSVRDAARDAGAARRSEILDRAKEDALQASRDAQKHLEAEIDAAREQLRQTATTTAAEIASIVLGRRVA